jgi:hypothetical protein
MSHRHLLTLGRFENPSAASLLQTCSHLNWIGSSFARRASSEVGFTVQTAAPHDILHHCETALGDLTAPESRRRAVQEISPNGRRPPAVVNMTMSDDLLNSSYSAAGVPAGVPSMAARQQ